MWECVLAGDPVAPHISSLLGVLYPKKMKAKGKTIFYGNEEHPPLFRTSPTPLVCNNEHLHV